MYNNNIKEEVFDAVFTAALAEYIDNEMAALPSREELAKMYQSPKNGLRRIRRKLKEKSHRHPMPVVYLQRAAVVFLAAVTLSAGILATNTEVRAAATKAILKWRDEYVRVTFGDSDRSNDHSVNPELYSFTIGYVLERLDILEILDESDLHRSYLYTADDEEYLLICIDISGGTCYLNTENSECSMLLINGYEAYITYNKNENAGTIVYEADGYTISVGGVLDKSELIKVAENIKK